MDWKVFIAGLSKKAIPIKSAPNAISVSIPSVLTENRRCVSQIESSRRTLTIRKVSMTGSSKKVIPIKKVAKVIRAGATRDLTGVPNIWRLSRYVTRLTTEWALIKV